MPEMEKISEEYLEEHESELVKCPKCGSTGVFAKQGLLFHRIKWRGK